MTKEKIKDISIRAAKTFIQAFIGSISVETILVSGDRSVIRSVMVSAFAAGISAVMNFLIAQFDTEM